eukprot:276304_1
MAVVKSGLSKNLNVTGDDTESRGSICKVFWTKYYFLIGLVFVLVFGSTVPTIGHKHGPLATPITASWISVCLIFLVTGLGVKTKEIKKATLFWQLNLFVHSFIYIYHPCIGIALVSILKATTHLSPYLLDGLLITLCLPTTISSAVVLTVNSNGNEAASVVNTAVANLLGILLTPALIFIFLGNLGSVDIATVFYKLALRVVVPFGLGQIIRNSGDRVRQNIKTYKPILKKISETLLLFIVFCAISESFYTGLDAGYIDIIVMFVIIFCIHVITLGIVWYLSGINDSDEVESRRCCKCKNGCMEFNIYDRIAILFCASQKTAAFGIPIVSSLFETTPYLGIYLVPLLIYHPLQLIIDSFLVQPLANKVSKYEENQEVIGKRRTYMSCFKPTLSQQ